MLRIFFLSIPARYVHLLFFIVREMVTVLFFSGLVTFSLQRHVIAAPDDGLDSFDADFIHQTSDEKIDVTQFSHRNALAPGYYDISVVLNENTVGNTRLLVQKKEEKSVICATSALIKMLPVKSEEIDRKKLPELNDTGHCRGLEYWIPSASGYIDISTLRMIISVPQALLVHRAQDEVDPSQWDNGINALIFGYDANYYESKQNNNVYRSFYNGDNIGLNLWGFMLRHRGSMSWQENSGFHYLSLRNYVEHDISALKSRIVVGDTDTSGNLFDSFSLRGLMLYSDDNMLPDSRRGYAPLVRGVAETNAQITVRQNNTLLYETTVPPGPFSIDDLYPTGYGGDLTVTIRESDGRTHHFTVPYAAVPQLVRPGITRYNLSAGTLRNMNVSKRDAVAQLTLQQGVNNVLTRYGGILTTRDYHAFLLGGAVGTGWGALALDATHAQTRTALRRFSGQNYRATFSKQFRASNSSISISAGRTSSSGYLGLNEAVSAIDSDRLNNPVSSDSLLPSSKSRFSASLSQGFPDYWGQFYLTVIRQSHWGKKGHNNQLQLGYSNAFRTLSWSLSVNQISSRTNTETQYMLGLSIPLGSTERSTHLNMSLGHDSEGMTSQANINSSFGAEQQLDYSLGMRHDSKQRTSANLAANWHTPYASLRGSVEKSRHSQSWSGGMSGSVVTLTDGMVTSPWYSETMALVDAPHASGARVEGHSGLMLNQQGRALVPHLSPYRLNEITLDPQGLPENIELKSTRQQTAPHTGALVKVNYATSRGRPVLIHSTQPDGKSLPFGAVVQDEQGNNLGMVTQGDMIYVRLPEGPSTLKIKSGDFTLCTLSVQLSKHAILHNGFERLSQHCLPTSEPKQRG